MTKPLNRTVLQLSLLLILWIVLGVYEMALAHMQFGKELLANRV